MVEERRQRGVARVTAARELLTTSQSPDDINLHHAEEALRPPQSATLGHTLAALRAKMLQ